MTCIKEIETYMDSGTLTAIATILLVLVGFAQILILNSQKRQTRIALIAQYRQLWTRCKEYFGNVIFIGRETGEYYQIHNETKLKELEELVSKHRLDMPTTWALESVQNVFNVLDELTTRILQGHLKVSDTYPIVGTGFLRHSRPLRQLLDSEYHSVYFSSHSDKNHRQIHKEMQNWLIYHDGLRRRCLILIDIFWAEAVRLEDLPPSDIRSAADAKKKTGKQNRRRIFRETIRLNGLKKLFLAMKLSRFLKRAEYKSFWNFKGLKRSRLDKMEKNWTKGLLREK
ncbi:hypothetical protein [Mesonia sp.]|uniref:hypothetical protein n=1 Tax=Mesonia sp. TaxID=1960830 RepID=UPI00257A71E8|nr:hypothetical protein [Mesonia sp.]